MRLVMSSNQTTRVLSIEEVSLKIGKSVSWLYKNHKKYQINHKFPAPINGLGCKWDSTAIDLWFDMNLPNHLRVNDNFVNSNPWQSIMSRRAANL